MFHRNPIEAFDDAIARGVLSDVPGDANYAGLYMYMFSDHDDGRPRDAFKHCDTRQYLYVRE